MPAFDGIDFTGPAMIDDLPRRPGIYLIATDASGGVKLLGAYDGGDDMSESASSNTKKECWKRNMKDSEPYAFYRICNDPDERVRICRGIVDRRFYEMVCNDPPVDDF